MKKIRDVLLLLPMIYIGFIIGSVNGFTWWIKGFTIFAICYVILGGKYK